MYKFLDSNVHPYGAPIRGRGRGGPLRGRGRGRGRGVKRGRGTSRNSEPADMRMSHDSVTQRVLSASRNRVNEYKNKVEELKLQVRDLHIENRLYKKMQFRQEKALKGFEDKENDLPNILDKHNNEIRYLKEQNRRLKEKFDKSDRYLRDAEDELERMKKRLKKYKEVVDEKQLMEREELSKKLTKAEIDMEERDVKIKELQRHIESLKKNHRHELGIEIARQKEMKRQMEELEEQNSRIGSQLKEKEKALEYKNIYSKTIDDNAQGMSSVRSKPPKKASSMTDLTPRDKAKFYAEKRREELKKQKQIKEDQEKKKHQQWEQEERERQKEMNVSPPGSSTPPPFSFNSIDRDLEEREREEARRLEEEQRMWRERERQEASQKEEIERRRRDLERRQEENKKSEQEDRERKEREEQRRREFEKEENERRERERKQREEEEERQRRERLELERREKEKEEQERRFRIEREKAENDPKIQEERRKKDELLKKLQAMDELGSAGTTTSPQHKRVQDNSRGGSSVDGRSSRKEYSFSKPVNNLHQGKRTHEEVDFLPRAGRRQLAKDSNGADGYQPSFGPSKGGSSKAPISSKPLSIFNDDEPAFKPTQNSGSKEKKSSNLLENLFGPNASKDSSRKKSEENETFFVTSKSPPQTKKSSEPVFPWDSKTSATKTNGSVGGSSTIYGGGAAILDDDDFSHNRSKVLPRRGRQNNVNTFASKPTVTAVDAFDDDLEEVVL